MSAPPQRAFDPELMTGVLPDGRIAVVDSTTYEVKFVEIGSGITSRLSRPFSPRGVTRRDRVGERGPIDVLTGDGEYLGSLDWGECTVSLIQTARGPTFP